MGGDLDGYNSYAQRGNMPIIESRGRRRSSWRLFPASSARLRILRSWGGVMDMSMDGSPIICQDTRSTGLYLNGGWCYGGFKATPGVGLGLRPHHRPKTGLIRLNAAFTLERFAAGRMPSMRRACRSGPGGPLRQKSETMLQHSDAPGVAFATEIRIRLTAVTVSRPIVRRRPQRRSPIASWVDYTSTSATIPGRTARRATGTTAAGCRQWLTAATRHRDSQNHSFTKPPLTSPWTRDRRHDRSGSHRLPVGGSDRPRPAPRLHLQRAVAVEGYRRRYLGLGACSRQRRPPGRDAVSSTIDRAASSAHGERRTERPGPSCGTGARTRTECPAPRAIELYDGLVAASQNCWPSVGLRPRRGGRPRFRPSHAIWFLLQDIHVARLPCG